MKKIPLNVTILFFSVSLLFSASPPKPWSVRIGDSFMSLHPDTVKYYNEEKSKKWNYEQGLMLEALYQLWTVTKDDRYLQYIKKNLDYYIQPNGSIATYTLKDFNIDNVSPGKITLRAFELFKDTKYKRGADTLRKQLSLQPRTSEGGFWHKKIYPNQMWLDGLYMGEPFYALYSKTTNDTAAFDDIARQFLLIASHSYDPKTGLYYHGWDESKKQQWADPKTGCSPNFWGRSIGWYAMALVDVLDDFPKQHPQRTKLESIFATLMESILKQRDEKSKVWYQVVDKQREKGNYLEASASSMFTYAMAKGVNKGLLKNSFATAAKESFEGIIKTFVTTDAGHYIYLNNVCSVAGLGGKPYRDGSFDYYVGEPQRTNDFKGYGPFLLAAIEVEKLQHH